jgi:hypothetical protein
MKKLFLLTAAAILALVAAACSGNAAAFSGNPDGVTASFNPSGTPTRTASRTPTVSSATPSATPTVTSTSTATPTPTLAPDAWQFLPVAAAAGENARRIYRDGQGFGNDPRAFSILGDCLSLPVRMFYNFGLSPSHYNLGDYYYLQPAIDWFKDSFERLSVSLGNGFNTAAVLSPLRSNRALCRSDENPMACEYRIHRPSFAIISLGTDDYRIPPDTYEQRMREIIEYTISAGIVPILATKADNREGKNAFNRIVAGLAYEYDVPLWNFWAAVQSIPNRGLADAGGHLTWGDPYNFANPSSLQFGIPLRNLTALQSLDAVWRGVTAS